MSIEKLGNIEESTVTQDFDKMERDLITAMNEEEKTRGVASSFLPGSQPQITAEDAHEQTSTSAKKKTPAAASKFANDGIFPLQTNMPSMFLDGKQHRFSAFPESYSDRAQRAKDAKRGRDKSTALTGLEPVEQVNIVRQSVRSRVRGHRVNIQAMVAAGLVPDEMRKELEAVRFAKEHTGTSLAYVLKGLKEGNEDAENIAAKNPNLIPSATQKR